MATGEKAAVVTLGNVQYAQGQRVLLKAEGRVDGGPCHMGKATTPPVPVAGTGPNLAHQR